MPLQCLAVKKPIKNNQTPARVKKFAVKSTRASSKNRGSVDVCVRSSPKQVPVNAKAHDVTEAFVWTCNLCQQSFRNHKKRSLACARRRHIRSTHAKEANLVHACFPRPKVQIAKASHHIPKEQRAWTCPKCDQGLAYMPRHMLKSSRDSHVMQCFKYSKAKLRRLHYKSPIWKDHHKNLVQKNAANKISLTNMELAAYNAQRGVNAFRFPRELHGSCAWFGCDVCTVLFQPFSGLKAHKCPGPEGRAKVLITGGRRRFWYKLRMRKNQEGAKLLAHHWKLSQDEVAILEKTWDTMSKKPTPAASQWIRDLTMEGIHPHPGPSRALRFCLINSNGRENTWALARWAVSDRIEMCVIAEHCMLPQHQADLARYLLLKGYRSWFVAPPAVQNVKGQWYTSGGVAVFVRSDKPCREIQQCITPDGQAIMMQLDHAYVIGTYIPPRIIPKIWTSWQLWMTGSSRSAHCSQLSCVAISIRSLTLQLAGPTSLREALFLPSRMPMGLICQPDGRREDALTGLGFLIRIWFQHCAFRTFLCPTIELLNFN